MIIFDLLSSLLPTIWKYDKKWFIHEFLIKTIILGLKSLLYWLHLNVFFPLSILRRFTKVGFRKKKTSHWSYSNDLSICISWWFMQLLLNTKYLLYRSHYMTSQQCMLSVELLGNFSVKILHYSSHIYKGSPHCVFSDDLQK